MKEEIEEDSRRRKDHLHTGTSKEILAAFKLCHGAIETKTACYCNKMRCISQWNEIENPEI